MLLFVSSSSSSIFEVQRFWVRDDLDDQVQQVVTKKSHHKRQKSDKGVEDKTGWILLPVLKKEDACIRCKEKFDVTKDSSSSCQCHVDSEGNLIFQ